MKTGILTPKALLTLAVMACTGLSGLAQEFDDIYYNPSKETKKAVKTPTAPKTYSAPYNDAWDTPNLGTQVYNPNPTIDVDAYNRQTPYYTEVVTGDSIMDGDEFTYTRRIEKFHNPDVVVNTNDADLIDYYYNTETASPSVVNIYVDSTPLWSWNYPYYYNSWAWSPYYYSSWWSPSWTWGWYDPYWSWGWGPSWSWGCGPSYGWGWTSPRPPHNWAWNTPRPGYTGPHRHTATGTPGYASRPAAGNVGNNRPAGSRPSANGNMTASGRPAQTGATRPGSIANASGNINSSVRPGGTLRPPTAGNTTSANRWPANVNTPSGITSRPGAVSTPAASARPGVTSTTRPSTTRPATSTTTARPSTSTTTTRPSSSSNYSTSRPSSSSSHSGFGGSTGGSRGSFGGGGGFSGGGGGGRGRR